MTYELDQKPEKGQPSPEHVTGPQQKPYWEEQNIPGTPGHPEYNLPTKELYDRYVKQQEEVRKAGGGHQGQYPSTGVPPQPEGGKEGGKEKEPPKDQNPHNHPHQESGSQQGQG